MAADTKICLTIRNRLSYTKKTIDTLKEFTPRDQYELYIFDNMSDRDLEDQWTYLRKLYQRGHVDCIVVNSEVSTMKCWSKSFAINQCIKMCELQDAVSSHWEWFVILDNDMIFRKPWLELAKNVYKEAKKKYPNILVCSPWNDPNPEHKTFYKDKFCDMPVNIKSGNGAGCWIVHREFIEKIGLAGVGKGYFSRGSSDWNYQSRMQEVCGSAENFVAFDDSGQSMETIGYAYSERLYKAKCITGQNPKEYWNAFSKYLDEKDGFRTLKEYINKDERFKGWSYLIDKDW